MKIGMLWFDNDAKTALSIRVNRAALYYHQKYGLSPDTCLVHPSMLEQHHGLVENHAIKVKVTPDRAILPGHLWIGIDNKK